MPMKMSGKLKSATIRVRSRRSLMRSRCASVRTPESSCILQPRPDDLEIGILEGRCVRAYDREGRLDGAQHRMNAAAGQHDLERPVAGDRELEARELFAQATAVIAIDDDVLLDEL